MADRLCPRDRLQLNQGDHNTKKRPLFSLAALFLGFYLVACASRKETQPAPKTAATGDTEAFATLFPQRGVWTLESTVGDTDARSVHSTLDLRRDLKDRRGLYESFFEGDGDSIRDHVESTHGRPWQRAEDARFSPPDRPDMRELMYIRWRLEDGVWIVDAVAAPFAY